MNPDYFDYQFHYRKSLHALSNYWKNFILHAEKHPHLEIITKTHLENLILDKNIDFKKLRDLSSKKVREIFIFPNF